TTVSHVCGSGAAAVATRLVPSATHAVAGAAPGRGRAITPHLEPCHRAAVARAAARSAGYGVRHVLALQARIRHPSADAGAAQARRPPGSAGCRPRPGAARSEERRVGEAG